mgnify:CR=1 FL=1
MEENDIMHERMWSHIEHFVHENYDSYKEFMGDDCPPEYRVVNNLRQIVGMEFFMRGCNDERYYVDWWLYEYPDGADLGALMEIAMDEDLMVSMLRTFMRIMADYLKKNSLYNLSYMSGAIDEERPEIIEEE